MGRDSMQERGNDKRRDQEGRSNRNRHEGKSHPKTCGDLSLWEGKALSYNLHTQDRTHTVLGILFPLPSRCLSPSHSLVGWDGRFDHWQWHVPDGRDVLAIDVVVLLMVYRERAIDPARNYSLRNRK